MTLLFNAQHEAVTTQTRLEGDDTEAAATSYIRGSNIPLRRHVWSGLCSLYKLEQKELEVVENLPASQLIHKVAGPE